MTRKEQRKASRQEKRAGPGPSRQHYADSDDEASEEDSSPPPPISKKKAGKRPAVADDEPPKKKKKLPELTLPGESKDDAEEQEIEWLEYMLHKEKSKAKADDDLDDGLDGMSLLGKTGPC